MDIDKKIFNKLLKTIEILELAGISRPVAEKQAYIRAAESLQKSGISVMKSIELIDNAMADIRIL